MRPPKGRVTSQPGTRPARAESCLAKGLYLEFYDPGGARYGCPTYPWRLAPAGLATMRQLRARGLRPGGQDIAAQILWWHGGGRRRTRRVAYLYRENLALPKRTATPAQIVAIGRALAARHTCVTCGMLRDYHMPRSGECNECSRGRP